MSADWIGNLSEFDGGGKDVVVPRETIDSIADASSTILLCAQHQKRIIDDILTLSKLDADLLFIAPIEAQPVAVVRDALKMFEGELHKADLTLRFIVEESYTRLSVDWVKLDPSRVNQVFINLISNAIKFTSTEEKRQIVVKVGASTEPPKPKNDLEFLPKSHNTSNEILSCGTPDQTIYLSISVQDSGRGLDENEKNQLFKRFSQASVRTHVQYGGNGLGLFISRRLTEIQGGQIGVASAAGVGSTFAFYIQTPRCDAPERTSPRLSPVDIDAHTKLISPAVIANIRKSPLPKVHEGRILEIPAAPKHVLVVEDNLVNQKVLSKQLRAAGCIVAVANHGREALEFLQTTHFWTGLEDEGVKLSIVLMDLEMPVMDGLTCVQKIRELQKEGKMTSHVPVIAVTANARSEQIANAKEHGMDSVVTKPFRIPELLPEMDRVLRRARGEDRPVVGERSLRKHCTSDLNEPSPGNSPKQ
ncbi:putative Hybrid signal transduction histidine kinase K [Glarea lozoyensis 74030]|uniref:Putative Hybrid signal transduction histidine kinase K n=1 Tax=Glarea lozoyensis (strain ATCC 74030 / MF5533) TaxID=1104152 RepID=H0EI34_GLAL7|nr:putative Hybrid signal transduction histidine kinase K [Glarea lozoyensis 74030]